MTCHTCIGYGLRADLSGFPAAATEPTVVCMECGANANPVDPNRVVDSVPVAPPHQIAESMVERIKLAARAYCDTHVDSPFERDYLYAENLAMTGAQAMLHFMAETKHDHVHEPESATPH